MREWITYDVDGGIDGGIACITLNRPDKRNAMTYGMLDDFRAAVRRAGDDAAARAVVVTGSGGSFCAGTDLSELSETSREERGGAGQAEGDAEPGPWAAWPLLACPKPVVAAVDGPAVGMGAEFTSQADVRIASTRARFAWNFGLRGLVPDTGAGSWLLPRLVGVSQALRLLYSADFLDAWEAQRLGYVVQVVEPGDLHDAATEEARRYLATSPFATAKVKELTYRGLDRGLDEHLRHHREALEACFRSADHREGVAAFLERRQPRFTGR